MEMEYEEWAETVEMRLHRWLTSTVLRPLYEEGLTPEEAAETLRDRDLEERG